MALIDELKERREAVANRLEDAYVSTGNLRAELDDLDRAIDGLKQPADAPIPDEQPELFEAEKAEAREQLEADHALPVAADDVVLTDSERWKYRVCWDGEGDEFGDSHHETKAEGAAQLAKLESAVSVIAASLHELYSDGEGGVLWHEIGRFERAENDDAADGSAPVNDGDRPALDADMRDDREQPVEAIGYFIRDGQSLELRSDGTISPLTAGDGAAPGAPWQADYWSRKLSSPIAVAKRETEEAS